MAQQNSAQLSSYFTLKSQGAKEPLKTSYTLAWSYYRFYLASWGDVQLLSIKALKHHLF